MGAISDLYRRDSVRPVLVGLLVVDALFVAAHFLRGMTGISFFAGDEWALWKESGFGEWWGYSKMITAALVLAAVKWRRTRVVSYLVWSVVWLVVAADDMLTLHERTGRAFEAWGVSLHDALGPQDSGELVFWAVMGTLLGGAILLTLPLGKGERANSLSMFRLVLVLAFFSVGLDLARSVILAVFGDLGLALSALLTMEDGGELVTMSFILAYCVGISMSDRRGPLAAESPRDEERQPTQQSARDNKNLIGES